MRIKSVAKIAKQVLFMMIVFGLSASTAQSKISGSKLVLDSLGHDFKQVPEEAVVSHAFQVSNPGDKVLEINKVTVT